MKKFSDREILLSKMTKARINCLCKTRKCDETSMQNNHDVITICMMMFCFAKNNDSKCRIETIVKIAKFEFLDCFDDLIASIAIY